MNLIKNTIQTIKRSLTDFSFYQEIQKKSFMQAVQYLYLLTFIVLIVSTAIFVIDAFTILPKLPDMLGKLNTQLTQVYPRELQITIKDGVVKTNANKPTELHLPLLEESTKFTSFIKIDTAVSPDSYPDQKTLILVTENAVVMTDDLSDLTQYRAESVSQLDNTVITYESYQSFIQKFKKFSDTIPVIAPWLLLTALIIIPFIGSIFLVLSRLLFLCILTIVVWPVSIIFGQKFRYVELVKMGVYALTFPIVLGVFFSIVGLNAPLVFTSSFLFWMVFMLSKLKE